MFAVPPVAQGRGNVHTWQGITDTECRFMHVQEGENGECEKRQCGRAALQRGDAPSDRGTVLAAWRAGLGCPHIICRSHSSLFLGGVVSRTNGLRSRRLRQRRPRSLFWRFRHRAVAGRQGETITFPLVRIWPGTPWLCFIGRVLGVSFSVHVLTWLRDWYSRHPTGSRGGTTVFMNQFSNRRGETSLVGHALSLLPFKTPCPMSLPSHTGNQGLVGFRYLARSCDSWRGPHFD